MTLKRKKLLALLTTMPTVLGEMGHRLRHHGKHHERELLGATAVTDVINTTSSPFLDRTSCYSTNEVLIIIGLTCVLNLAFIAAVISCVHCFTSFTCHNTSSLDSLMPGDNESSDTEGEEFKRKHSNLKRVNLYPVSR